MSTGTKIFNSFLTNFLLISKINLAKSIFPPTQWQSRRRGGKPKTSKPNRRQTKTAVCHAKTTAKDIAFADVLLYYIYK